MVGSVGKEEGVLMIIWCLGVAFNDGDGWSGQLGFRLPVGFRGYRSLLGEFLRLTKGPFNPSRMTYWRKVSRFDSFSLLSVQHSGKLRSQVKSSCAVLLKHGGYLFVPSWTNAETVAGRARIAS